MTTWQPIESAPTDGESVLAIDELGYYYLVDCTESGHFFDTRTAEEVPSLQWWMPLPALPTKGQTE